MYVLTYDTIDVTTTNCGWWHGINLFRWQRTTGRNRRRRRRRRKSTGERRGACNVSVDNHGRKERLNLLSLCTATCPFSAPGQNAVKCSLITQQQWTNWPRSVTYGQLRLYYHHPNCSLGVMRNLTVHRVGANGIILQLHWMSDKVLLICGMIVEDPWQVVDGGSGSE